MKLEGKQILVRMYDTVCGTLVLGSYGDSLCLCDWKTSGRHERNLRRLCRGLSVGIEEGLSDVTAEAVRQLEEYLSGTRMYFDIPLLVVGTDFQKEVWEALRAIPYGHTVTYGEVACHLGMRDSVRAVAGAIGANALSLFIPCHRVVGADGRITGYAGGLAAKQFLLALERGQKAE